MNEPVNEFFSAQIINSFEPERKRVFVFSRCSTGEEIISENLDPNIENGLKIKFFALLEEALTKLKEHRKLRLIFMLDKGLHTKHHDYILGCERI